MTKPIETLMQKEVSRGEFLATLGFGVVSILGFSSIIHMLSGKPSKNHFASVSSGYSSSTYGGGKD